MTLLTPAFAADEPTISGTVFRDFNSNGQFDAAKADGSASAADGLIDVGLGGADGNRTKVDAYAQDGSHIGSQVEVNDDGTYTLPLTGITSGSPVRVVFSGYPSDFYDSYQGSSSGSSVQFVTAGASSVNLGLHRLDDYSKGLDSPVFTGLQAQGTYDGVNKGKRALTSIPGTLGQNATTADSTTLASFGQIGATWGTDYQTDDTSGGAGYVYVAASLKRYSGFGPQGIGGIYRVPVTADGRIADDGNATSTNRSWLDVTTLGVDLGTVTRDLSENTGTGRDADAWDKAGLVGIGGIAVSGDSLFFVNLNDHKIYEVDIPSQTLKHTYAPVSTWSDGGKREQPWALTVRDGQLYTGIVDIDGTNARVSRTAIGADSWAAAPGLGKIDLSYKRGYTSWGDNSTLSDTAGVEGTQWHKWTGAWGTDTDAQNAIKKDSVIWPNWRHVGYAQPILSGLSFDESGNVVLGLADRWSLTTGYRGTWPDGTYNYVDADGVSQNYATNEFGGVVAGDTLFAGNQNGTWTLEKNGEVTVSTPSGSTETRTAQVVPAGQTIPADEAKTLGIQGLGGKEFFEDRIGWDGGNLGGVIHEETTLGAVKVLPGLQQVVSTAYDPQNSVETGGNKWLSLSDGQSLHGFDQYSSSENGFFGKGGGLGGLAVLTSPSPLQIGNRVWLDADNDGVQDAGEPSLGGVTVTLKDKDGKTVATKITDAQGNYLFSSDDKDSALQPNTEYTLVFSTPSEATQSTVIASLDGTDYAGTTWGQLKLTTQTATGGTTDAAQQTLVDSNPDPTTGAFTYTTPSLGANDHSLDAGYGLTPAVSVGDYVWRDTDGDGAQDDGELGIPGVVLNVTDPDGKPVTDVYGNVVRPVTTDANGKYLFPALPVLPAGKHYTVTIDQDASKDALTGLEPTKNDGADGDTSQDSSTWSAESTDLTTNLAKDLTLDFGFVTTPPQPTPSVSVGDLVWKDTNDDGVQGSEEPGIDGVVLKITGPDGNPVTDVNGKPVGPETTKDGGKYSFADLPVLPAGEHYTVAIDQNASKVALTGLEPTKSNVGDPAKDSSEWSATSGDLTTDKAQDLTLDFGFVNTPPQPAPSVSVGDYVWVDGDADGLQGGAADKALPGVTLTITRSDGSPVTAADGVPLTTDQLSTKTDATGKYEFTGLEVLPAGTHYVVTVTTPEGYEPTEAGAGSDRGKDSSTGSATSSDLTTDGANDPTLDFGFVKLPTPSVSVGDLVWKDTNGDGVQGSEEPGIDGVVLKITGPDGNPVTDVNGKPVGPETTKDGGKYSFADLPVLPAGEHYTVTIDQDASKEALKGLEPTKAGAGSDRGKDSSTGSATSTDLTTDGASDTSLDFGFITPTYAVGDVVWVDADGNGQQGDAERLAGVTVMLLDADGNPVAGVEPVTTDEQGRYLFDKLPAGDYRVKFTLTDEQAAKYQFTGKSVEGSTAEDDSNADPATGISDVFTLGASNGNLTRDYTDQAFTATNGIDPTIDAGVTLKPVTPTPDEPGQPAQTETQPANQGESTPSSLARTGLEAGAGALGIALLAAGLLLRRSARRRDS
ncbi:SdrD B-like domain-containing protein [Pseudoclavibacter sp. 13-3]|uniref:SdrD B-like domain-containing protein n=1 Tax=Pseudoclavibacter sp. 13-3 TaxID=2901228 RepID=UPI001E45689F|nr:SdrD B-like domain-containing protein [Pseudoclavibacter sp. 13-3]MCD7101119.1 hypothetical protein [Pseudoclavibacter sp. 13-3]